MPRSRVVVDIETVGCGWETLSDEERAYLIKKVERDGGNETSARESLALSAFTGEVALIGMLNPGSGNGALHVRWPSEFKFPFGFDPPTLPINPDAVRQMFGDLGAAMDDATRCFDIFVWPDEPSLLAAFWEGVQKYDQIITYNGRGFDGPFLMHRSFLLGARVGRDLVPNRYHDSHVDLMDRLSFYGATRPYTLDFVCRRLGIPSPKANGVTGKDVERLWRAGELAKVCAYLTGDLRTTAAVFARYVATFGRLYGFEPVARVA